MASDDDESSSDGVESGEDEDAEGGVGGGNCKGKKKGSTHLVYAEPSEGVNGAYHADYAALLKKFQLLEEAEAVIHDQQEFSYNKPKFHEDKKFQFEVNAPGADFGKKGLLSNWTFSCSHRPFLEVASLSGGAPVRTRGTACPHKQKNEDRERDLCPCAPCGSASPA